jgi:hypothetical protein
MLQCIEIKKIYNSFIMRIHKHLATVLLALPMIGMAQQVSET